MVLVLPSKGPIPEGADLLQAIHQDPQLHQANAVFRNRAAEDPVPASCRSACALMGEEALVDFSGGPWHVGSADATTCLIAVVLCRVTRKAWAAHYNSALADSDTSIMRLLPRHMQRPELWLVGSFREASGESSATLHAVLQCLQACELPFLVRLACVDAANTDETTGGPRALHLSVCCCTDHGCGDASPAGFEDRGPELPRRFAHDNMEMQRGENESALRSIVDTETGRLRISGLRCRPLYTELLAYFAMQLQLPADVFLRRNSTSPDYEPPNFVDDFRGAYQYILEQAAAGARLIPDALFEWTGAWASVSESG